MRVPQRILLALFLPMVLLFLWAGQEKRIPDVAAPVHAQTVGAPAARPAPASQRIALAYRATKSIAWSSDSKWLYSLGGIYYLFRWENGTTWTAVETLNHAGSIVASPTSTKFMLGAFIGRPSVRGEIFSVAEFYDDWGVNKIRVYKIAERPSMNVLALSADDRLFATATGLSCQIEIWSSEDGKRLHVLGEASKQPKTVGSPCVKAVAFSPDGTRAAALIEPAGSSLVLSIWNIADEKLIGNPVVVAAEGDYAALKFEPDGKTVSVVYCGLVTFWNPEAGTPPRVVRAPEPIMPMPDKPNGIIVDVFVTRFGGAIFAGATALAPDGEKAASLTQDGSIAIWSIETLKVVQTLPSVEATRRSETFGGELVALRYSPNGRRLAGVTHVGEIVFWEVP